MKINLTIHVTPEQATWIKKVLEIAEQIDSYSGREKKITIKFQKDGVNVESVFADNFFYKK